MSLSSHNRIEIDLQAIQHNYLRLIGEVGHNVGLLAVVKSDAYGHGLVETARSLAAVGADHFGVADVREAILLREAGVSGRCILLAGVSEENITAVIDHRLSPVVFSQQSMAALSHQATCHGCHIGVYLKIDVGMGRLGVLPHEAAWYFEEIGRLPGLFLAGVLSHFPMADDPDGPTLEQNEKFSRLLRDHEIGASLAIHAANSAALIRFPEARYNLVRPGIALYGCSPLPADVSAQRIDLRPAMRFKTAVIQVREVPAGFGISYGHKYITDRPSRLAVLPVGYADGYLRSLSNKADVLIGGFRVKLRGTVCMNLCIVDVTDIPPVAVGQEAVLMGSQKRPDGSGEETISPEEIAEWMGTISYEVLCLLGSSNQRVYG